NAQRLVTLFKRHLGSSSQESGAFAILDFGFLILDSGSAGLWLIRHVAHPSLVIQNPKSKIQNREPYVNRNTIRFESDRESAEDRLRAEGQSHPARARTPGALAADGTLSSALPGAAGTTDVCAARWPALCQLRYSHRHGDEQDSERHRGEVAFDARL